MSKNFELLSQLRFDSDVFPSIANVAAAESTGHASERTIEKLPEIGEAARTSGNGKHPNSYSEAINLAQHVFLAKPEIAPHMVVFTSPQRGAGCSWVCARTSEALADRIPGGVCVVDANLGSPAMHRYFGLDNSRGLTQALFDTGPIFDYVQEVQNRKLSVLTSGPVVNQTTACASDKLAKRLAELRQTFGFLLIDTPATNRYADAALLSSVADGAILVIEADSSRRQALQAKEALVAAKLRLLGVALNKRIFPIPEFIYRSL